ncbi:MAG: HK97 gp10 family phage protein [Rhizobiales bacterium]|nr:HK97 gp10 family phage protein [Hyphomicrobiales bacterium]
MKIQNADRFLRKLERMPKVAKAEIQTALKASAEGIAGTARRMAPKKSGALARSIGTTIGKYVTDNANVRGVQATAGGHDLSVTIHAGDEIAWYAALVEYGTAPHYIVAKRARALGVGGRLGKRVHHPGAAPQPFFWPAWRLGKKPAKRLIAAAVRKAAKKVAAGS